MSQTKNTGLRERVLELARKYLGELARRFPVMCSSDEFHFLPRALVDEEAGARLDSLDSDLVQSLLYNFRDTKGELSRLDSQELDPESRADLELLLSSIAAFELDFEAHPIYRREPVIYLKIMGIGLAQALDAGEEALIGSIRGAMRLAREAAANTGSVAGPHLAAALRAADDLAGYLAEDFKMEMGKRGLDSLTGELDALLSGLEELRAFLGGLTPAATRREDAGYLERLLSERFRVKRGLAEIFEMGLSELSHTLEELKKTAREIDGSTDWQSLYWGYLDDRARSLPLEELYPQEMESLRSFFLASNVVPLEGDRAPYVMETPRYLRSVRGAASYAAPGMRNKDARGVFYLLTGGAGSEDGPGTHGGRLAREYKFLTAHETYPGHHVLDSHRLKNPNPVRAAVESPLFYEGWATYAESLLRETGYTREPRERLAELKRRAWRAARLLSDVGPAAAGAGARECAGWLVKAGFAEEDARAQIERYRLTRGYQLCYTLGSLEILGLREKYGERLGLERFHRELLTGGQVPFHILDTMLDAAGR